MIEILEPILTIESAFALAIVMTGGIVRGYTGFGSGLVMAPLLSIFWGPVDAVAVTVGIGIFSAAQMLVPAAKNADWRTVGPMSLAAVLFIPVGTFLLVTLDPEIVKNIIAAIVLFLTIISLRGWTYKGPAGPIPAFLAGTVGALVNGIAAIGGPANVMYLMSLPNEAHRHRANISMITSVMGGLVMVYMLIGGAVTTTSWIRIGLLAFPGIVGVWIGTWLFSKLPGKIFKLIVLWMLVAVSVAILVS